MLKTIYSIERARKGQARLAEADGKLEPQPPTQQGCALVTGASRGIGAATARALAEKGWPVGVSFRSDSGGAEALVAELEGREMVALPVRGDISDPADVESVFSTLESRFGRVLVLVNNAGIRADGLCAQIDDEDWDRVLKTNLSAPFLTTRRALRRMIQARFGRIVNIASIVGPTANPGQSNYAAAKAGLVGFTKTVAAEVARRGVTVNAVAPGLIDTELARDTRERVLPLVPARRAGTVEEVAAAVAFLASEEAGYVTGTTLTVDGGLTA